MQDDRRPVRPLRCLILVWGLAAAACAQGGPAVQVPLTPELQLTEAGHYRVSLRPSHGDAPLHTLHSWIFRVEDLTGQPVTPTRLAVSGGMPQHAHGFVTEPRITEALGAGEFLVGGVRFHMAGDWMFRFELVGPEGTDVAVFNVQVAP